MKNRYRLKYGSLKLANGKRIKAGQVFTEDPNLIPKVFLNDLELLPEVKEKKVQYFEPESELESEPESEPKPEENKIVAKKAPVKKAPAKKAPAKKAPAKKTTLKRNSNKQ